MKNTFAFRCLSITWLCLIDLTIAIAAQPVQISEILVEPVSTRIRTFGVLAPNVEEISFQKAGRIERFLVEDGDRVEKDQVLAELNTVDAQERLKKRQLGLDAARNSYARVAKLFKDGFTKRTAFEASQDQLERSQIDFDQAQLDLQRSQLVAPSAGIILKQLVDSRTSVQAGQIIYVFLGDGEPWITKVNLTARNAFLVNSKTQALVEFSPYPDEIFNGTISKIAQVANPADGLYTAELTISSAGQKLRSGMIAEVDLVTTSERSYSVIPFDALLDVRGKKATIYVISEDQQFAIEHTVTIHNIIGTKVAITESLLGSVVTRGNHTLIDKSEVSIRE